MCTYMKEAINIACVLLYIVHNIYEYIIIHNVI